MPVPFLRLPGPPVGHQASLGGRTGHKKRGENKSEHSGIRKKKSRSKAKAKKKKKRRKKEKKKQKRKGQRTKKKNKEKRKEKKVVSPSQALPAGTSCRHCLAGSWGRVYTWSMLGVKRRW